MEDEMNANKSKILKIILIVIGILAFGAVAFLIGLNFPYGQTEEKTAFYEENGTAKEVSGRERPGGNSSNDSMGGKTIYHDNGEKWAEARGIFNEDGDLTGREITIYDEKGNVMGEGRGEFYDYNFMYGPGERTIYDEKGRKRVEIRGYLDGGGLNGEFVYYDEDGGRKIEKKGNFTVYEMAGDVLPHLPRIKWLIDRLQTQDLIERLRE